VIVTVDGQKSGAEMFLEAVGRPVVLSISTSTIGFNGSVDLVVYGASFGSEARDIAAVTIGRYRCTVRSWSRSLLRVDAPPGVGMDLPLVVTNRAGLSSADLHLVAFDPPVVESLSPTYTFLGKTDETFVLLGRNLGHSASDLTSLSIGGQVCAQPIWMSSASVSCMRTVGATWLSGSVSVTVGNQRADSPQLFTGLGQPVVERISPQMADEGETVTILGRNMGRSSDDVRSITVGPLDVDHATVQVISDSAISFMMPAKPAELLARAQDDPSVFSQLRVTVTTAGGLGSDVDGQRSFISCRRTLSHASIKYPDVSITISY